MAFKKNNNADVKGSKSNNERTKSEKQKQNQRNGLFFHRPSASGGRNLFSAPVVYDENERNAVFIGNRHCFAWDFSLHLQPYSK